MQTRPTLSLEYEYCGIHYRRRLCHGTEKEQVLERVYQLRKCCSVAITGSVCAHHLRKPVPSPLEWFPLHYRLLKLYFTSDVIFHIPGTDGKVQSHLILCEPHCNEHAAFLLTAREMLTSSLQTPVL